MIDKTQPPIIDNRTANLLEHLRALKVIKLIDCDHVHPVLECPHLRL